MTGKDLIKYILNNDLENNDISELFITEEDAATKYEVGVETILVWFIIGRLDGFQIGKHLFIPKNSPDPRGGLI